MIKPDLQALDDKAWRNRNVKAELAYCPGCAAKLIKAEVEE